MKLLMAVMVLITGLAGAQAHIDPETHAMLIYEDHMAVLQGLDTLTAVGYTDSVVVTGNLYHTVVITIGGTDDCDPVIQWSVDGLTWYTEYSADDAVAGTYEDHWEALCKYIRIGFTAEHGTSSTLTGVSYSGR